MTPTKESPDPLYSTLQTSELNGMTYNHGKQNPVKADKSASYKNKQDCVFDNIGRLFTQNKLVFELKKSIKCNTLLWLDKNVVARRETSYSFRF